MRKLIKRWWTQYCVLLLVGRQAARSGAGGGGKINIADSNNQQYSEFNLDPEGSLLFYILDAYEEIMEPNMGTLYLFGKSGKDLECRPILLLFANLMGIYFQWDSIQRSQT
ncbi:DNA-directed DNA polymerase [Trifolium repens]|nr:DNA-directed DNA polymerase [Trifolium repens]